MKRSWPLSATGTCFLFLGVDDGYGRFLCWKLKENQQRNLLDFDDLFLMIIEFVMMDETFYNLEFVLLRLASSMVIDNL